MKRWKKSKRENSARQRDKSLERRRDSKRKVQRMETERGKNTKKEERKKTLGGGGEEVNLQ